MKNIVEALTEKKLKVSFAESTTGGMLAAFITNFDGSSKVFEFSAVTYSNKMKNEILCVDEIVLKNEGPYSFEVVKQMAKGVREKSKSDIALAVSGVAGPNDENEVSAGICYFAIAFKNEFYTKKIVTGSKNRIYNRQIFLETAIKMLEDCINNQY